MSRHSSFFRHFSLLVVGLLAITCPETKIARAAEPTLDLDVVMVAGFPATDAQRWLETFKAAGLGSIRIHSVAGGAQPELTREGNTVRVVGVLAGDGELYLPGGKFSLGDGAAIAKWAIKTKQAPPPNAGKPLPFGLSEKELVHTHESLSVAVNFKTKGEKVGTVVPKISRLLPLKITLDAKAQAAVAGDETVADELEDVSAGTAIAAIARPLGLVLAPRKTADGGVELTLGDARASTTSWPVGWPPEKPPKDVLPALFATLEVEVKNTPLADALSALQTRLKVPFLYDYNGLARERIELEKFQPTLPSFKTFYKRVLDRLLYQAKLQCELRVDDAGKPFLWISPVKQ